MNYINSTNLHNKRNYGIDLLRIIAMLYVVILHCLGHGGVLNGTDASSVQYMVAWFIDIWAVCAVNMFAIISGYVGYSDEEKKHKYSTYIVMWLQVVSYSVIGVLIVKLIKPEAIGMAALLKMFMPVTNELYWYFTAYTGLFFLMPLLNAAVRGCSKETLKKTLLCILVLNVCLENVTGTFYENGGYSFVWLVLLYLIGAIIKKCDIGKNWSTKVCILGIIALVVISWLWKLYGVEFKIHNISIANYTLITYTSPTIVAIALLYVIGFSKMKFSDTCIKIIRFLAPGTFAVYLLNDNIYMREYVIKGRLAFLGTQPVFVMAGAIILGSFAFVILAILIDRVRIGIFRLVSRSS